ncbi:hypothetical protein quinque_002109 [Culex quinquefasciatus]
MNWVNHPEHERGNLVHHRGAGNARHLTRCCCVPNSARERKAGGLPGKCRIDINGYLIEIVICLMNGILWQPHKFRCLQNRA